MAEEIVRQDSSVASLIEKPQSQPVTTLDQTRAVPQTPDRPNAAGHPHLPIIDEFPEKTRPVAKEAYDRVRVLEEQIEQGYAENGTLRSQPWRLQEKIDQIGMPYGHYSTTQELADVIDDLGETVASIVNPDTTLQGVVERVVRMQNNIADAERENEAFPTSRELLIHDVGFNLHVSENPVENERSAQFARESLGGILRSGVLASRRYQIETQGRSYAHTGGNVVIGKDFIEYTEDDGEVKRIPKAEYHKLSKEAHGIRPPGEEEYQLFFGSIGKNPAGSKGSDIWSPYFTHGVTFVFSKPSLYSQSQFNDSGEIELYDRHYDSSNTNSPGFHIDLTKEPMLIVVDETIRDDFMEFVKGVDSPLWQSKGQDVDTWLQENVMFAQSGSYQNDTDRLRGVYRGIEARFFEKYPHITIQQGRFLPTGNKSGFRGSTSIYQPAPTVA